MPGVFSKSARPLRPGAYFNFIAAAPSPIPPVVGSIVAVPFTSDWGPFKEPVLVGSFQEYLAIFGPTIGTPGYNAVWQAFQGEGGIDGRFGAGAVLCYRMGAPAAAKASRILQNATPAAALTVTARYEGTYGSNLNVTTQDHAADATKNELVVKLGTQVLETYVYADTDIVALAAEINANSSWITATETVTGVALAPVANAALSGGNDGATLTGTEWSALLTALESQVFSVLVLYGLVDPTIIASVAAWGSGASTGALGQNARGHRFEIVYGGALDETADAAITDAATVNDPNFIRLGVGHVVDDNLLDANGNAQVLSTAQFAPRVAGALAARGEAMSLTSTRFPGVRLVNGASDADVVKTLNGGVVVLSLDSDVDAPVHIEAARTTFTSGAPGGAPAITNFPYLIYRNPKFLRTMQGIESEWTAWAQRTIIGKLPVNDKTRDQAIAELQARLRARTEATVILPGWTVAVDQNPPPSDLDEFIALVVGISFGRSVEQVFFTVNVS